MCLPSILPPPSRKFIQCHWLNNQDISTEEYCFVICLSKKRTSKIKSHSGLDNRCSWSPDDTRQILFAFSLPPNFQDLETSWRKPHSGLLILAKWLRFTRALIHNNFCHLFCPQILLSHKVLAVYMPCILLSTITLRSITLVRLLHVLLLI